MKIFLSVMLGDLLAHVLSPFLPGCSEILQGGRKGGGKGEELGTIVGRIIDQRSIPKY